ncbi:MAG: hypothetical protein M9962_05570 [Oligoflexia bacterium]|nr:hypothetical protein [Oligoflexia bacterium]
MNIFLSLLIVTISHAIDTEQLSFRYTPNEGSSSACEAKPIRDLPDWEIICDTDYGKKIFAAHIVLREFSSEHRSHLEILYWVTARSEGLNNPPKFHSTTSRMTFSNKAKPEEIHLSQGIENDFASLDMRWKR